MMENYEKMYKEALERAREFMTNKGVEPNADAFKTAKELIEIIFPELKKSDDERIRKELINFFSKGAEYDSSTNGIKDRNIIAWLEKQGERKEATCVAEIIDHLTEKEQEILFKELEMQKEQKPAWSEEDECMCSAAMELLITHPSLMVSHSISKDSIINWLKSLKDKIQPKQESEWDEEDIRNIQDIDSILFYDRRLPEDTRMRLRNWVKSLKDRIQP